MRDKIKIIIKEPGFSLEEEVNDFIKDKMVRNFEYSADGKSVLIWYWEDK